MSMHVPVLLDAALVALSIRPDGHYVDGTFGRGGHARALLQRLGPEGRLLLLDRDPAAAAVARELCQADVRCQFLRLPFSRMAEAIRQAWPDLGVDGVLLDLGVSSPQLDTPERGFSFQQDGPLDMRMDPTTGVPLAQWLGAAREEQIAAVLREYGDERFARRIAAAIVRTRRTTPLLRTRQLAELIRSVVPPSGDGKHPATRSFQALRIQVNAELEELKTCLETVPCLLRPGGRMVIISFHSLEDRLVKRCFQGRPWSAVPALPRGLPVQPPVLVPLLQPVGGSVRPDAQACRTNPRARSAVLRVAERTP
jgi:16S rRNA (cytosine1402-N4)-methyltransferase